VWARRKCRADGGFMTLDTGSYRLGPQAGRLLLKTGRTGFGRRAGHDLTIEATRWQADVVVNTAEPGQSSVTVPVEADSVAAREGTGGAQAPTAPTPSRRSARGPCSPPSIRSSRSARHRSPEHLTPSRSAGISRSWGRPAPSPSTTALTRGDCGGMRLSPRAGGGSSRIPPSPAHCGSPTTFTSRSTSPSPGEGAPAVDREGLLERCESQFEIACAGGSQPTFVEIRSLRGTISQLPRGD